MNPQLFIQLLASSCCMAERTYYVHLLSRFSHFRLFVTPWTVARQAPLSMRFSRQECWSGLSCPPPGDLPNPGSEPASLMSPALAGRFFTTNATWEAHLKGLGYSYLSNKRLPTTPG